MLPRARRKGTRGGKPDATPPEPSWRQKRLARPRAKMRKAQTTLQVISPVPGLRAWSVRLPVPAVRFRPALRHWLVLLVVTLAAYGAVQLANDDRFFVFAAEVHGNQRVPQEEIYAASDVDGKNIFWVSPQEIEKRVREVPGIEKATVRVRLPNQVVISVHERLPVVRWEANNQTTWVAEDGQPVPAAGAQPSLRLIDTTASAAGRQPGKTGLPKTLIADLLAIQAARSDLSEVYYGEQEGLYFRAPQGYLVYLGRQGDMPTKLSRLVTVQQQIAQEHANPKVVDLRLPGTVFYR